MNPLSPDSLATLVLTAGVASFFAGWLCYCFGLKRGRNEGWLEYHFNRIEQDKARRNRLGQFKTLNESSSHGS